MSDPALPAGASNASYVDAHSAGILRVSATTDPRKLASAIMKISQRMPRLAVRAAGDVAVNISVKACIIADGQAAQRGKTFFIKPTFDVVAGNNDSGEVTVIQFNLVLVTIGDIAPLYEKPR